MSEKESSTSGNLFAFLLGGVVGAAVALLLAPATGGRTRRRVRHWIDDGS